MLLLANKIHKKKKQKNTATTVITRESGMMTHFKISQ